MEKRQAEVLYAGDLADTENSIKLLKSARDHYWDAFLLDRTFTWAIVQYLSLDLIIGLSTRRRDAAAGPAAEVPQQGPSYPMEMNPERLWRLAFLLSRYDLNSQFRDARMWAHQNMIELHLLTTLMPAREAWAKKADERAIEYTDNFIEIAGPHTIDTYSTRRQMFRYVDWYPSLLPPPTPERLKKLAADICARFPAAVEEKGS